MSQIVLREQYRGGNLHLFTASIPALLTEAPGRKPVNVRIVGMNPYGSDLVISRANRTEVVINPNGSIDIPQKEKTAFEAEVAKMQQHWPARTG